MNPVETIPKPQSPLREALTVFFGNWAATIGLIILVIVILGSIFGPALYGVSPKETVNAPFLAPMVDPTSPLGTDYIGRDVLASILNGGSATIMIGAAAALVAVVIGITIGSLAGYYGGLVDTVLMRSTTCFTRSSSLSIPPSRFVKVLR